MNMANLLLNVIHENQGRVLGNPYPYPYHQRLIFFLYSDLVILVNNADFAKNLIETGSESNIRLAKHVIFDNDTVDSTIRVKRVDKQAVFVKVILKNYIGEINNNTDPDYRLRIMKSCILNQYTVVVLKKYSTYTQYVNERMRRYSGYYI